MQAVTTAIGMQHGFGSSLFAMALCFSLIVMYDAAGVRRQAGAQAEVLNTVVRELLSMHAVSQKKLKEVLGHTPLQVIASPVLGARKDHVSSAAAHRCSVLSLTSLRQDFLCGELCMH